MKNLNCLIYLFFLILFSCDSGHRDYDLIISNVNLIDGTGTALQENVNVYINNGKIHSINTNPVLQEQNVIDGSNKYLIPGLFDCHVHPDKDYTKDFKD